MGTEAFAETSYTKHSNSYNKIDLTEETNRYENWLERGTTDVYRHLRKLSVLDALLEHNKSSNWITIADGRFGTSAQYIKKKGAGSTPIDIDTRLLEIAKTNEWIDDFKNENAECLSFEDDSFDFAYCKDALHHFPRPMVALYEMLRVSSKAIVLTEPGDFVPRPPLGNIFSILKRGFHRTVLNKSIHTDFGNYEPVGNYIYSIGEREIEKIALGLNLPVVAFKRFQDTYLKGAETEQLSENGPALKAIKKADRNIKLLRAMGIQKPNYLQTIIFKTNPENSLRASLINDGYTVIDLPRNPYA